MKTAIEMAREAGFNFTGIRDIWCDSTVVLKAFEALVRADEREECIKLVHEGTGYPVQIKTLAILQKERKRIADAIRARGTT
jgi:hypothetical protein